MARAMFGTLQEFQPDVEPIKAYLERANVFFEANSIAADKRVPVLLSAIGPRIYSLLRNLTSPDVPHWRIGNYSPVTFSAETVTHRRTISFSSPWSGCGWVNRRIRRWVTTSVYKLWIWSYPQRCSPRPTRLWYAQHKCAEAPTCRSRLNLQEGSRIISGHGRRLKGTEAAVKKLSIPPKNSRGEYSATPKSTCYRCGRGNHDARSCRFADATCHKCGKKGHIAPVCRSGKKPQRSGPRKNKESPGTKYVATTEDDGRATDEFQLYTIGAKAATRPIIVDVQVNGKQLLMEVDTGAALSIISEQTWKTVHPGTTLKKADVVLTTYSKTSEQRTLWGRASCPL